MYLRSGVPFYIIGLLMYIVIKFLSSNMYENVYSIIIQVGIGALIYITFTILLIMHSKNKDISDLKTDMIQLFIRKTMKK